MVDSAGGEHDRIFRKRHSQPEYLFGAFSKPLFAHSSKLIKPNNQESALESTLETMKITGSVVQPKYNGADSLICQSIEKLEPRPGLEPGTCGLRNRRSTN